MFVFFQRKILELINEKSSAFENSEHNDFEKKEFLYQRKTLEKLKF